MKQNKIQYARIWKLSFLSVIHWPCWSEISIWNISEWKWGKYFLMVGPWEIRIK